MNKELKDINFNENFYEVDFIVNANCSYLSELIYDLDNGTDYYGQECPEPLVAVENLNVSPSMIQVIGSNKDTLKIIFNGITYIKFKASELIDELKTYNNQANLTIIGSPSVNTFAGRTTPQISIKEIEIVEKDKNGF